VELIGHLYGASLLGLRCRRH